MHREVRDHIEDVLAQAKGGQSADFARQHMNDCPECRDEVSAMADHAALLRELKAPETFEAEPRAGFYARVMERIEASAPVSIWNSFIESAFGRRLAYASLALALVLGVYLFTLERSPEEPMIAGDASQLVVPGADFDGPVATSVSHVEGVDGAIGSVGTQDPLAVQMDQFVNQMNQMMMQMQQSNSQDGVLSDLVTYREQ
jgi:hypothetical protein